MSPEITTYKINLKLKIFYYASIAFLPNIFLFNLYNNNRDAQILFQHVLILGVVLATVSIVMAWIIRFVLRSYEGSLMVLLLFWITFWFFEAIHSILPNQILNLLPINSRTLLLLGIFGAIISAVVFLRFQRIRFYKQRVIFNVLSAVTCLLFMFNAFPSFFIAVNTGSGGTFYIRSEFNVDSSLPSPDVYWFHMDGMISLNAVEYYFDTSQSETRERLLELGFVVNENAKLGAGGTVFGVSALLSPDFYDSYLHGIFRWDLLRQDGRQEIHREMIEGDGISFATEVAPYHELFHAFLQAGYTATMIARFSPNIFTPINQFYRLGGGSEYLDNYLFTILDQNLERNILLDALDLIELLVMMTPTPGRITTLISNERDFKWQAVPARVNEIDRLTDTTLNLRHERRLYQALIDHLETSQTELPTISYITLMFTHANNWGWQIGGEQGYESRIDLYPLAYEYALYIMFNMVDKILERNPDAIIVIQADHGMHILCTQQALLEAGLAREEVLRLYNSTISAIRIPEQYGGLDAPLDPLNITRELVNRFVGENYQLLNQ